MNHPAYRTPDVFVDITDTFEEKLQAIYTTFALPPERHEETEKLFRRLAAHYGFAAGVDTQNPSRGHGSNGTQLTF